MSNVAESKREINRRKESQKLYDYQWHKSYGLLDQDHHLVNLINYFDECLFNGENSIHGRRRFMDMFRQDIVYAWPAISKAIKVRLGAGEFSGFQKKISVEDIDDALEVTKKEDGHSELPLLFKNILTELFINGKS